MCVWENTGQPILVTPEESNILFHGTSENVMGGVFFGTDEFTGVTTTAIKRTDELPRNQITDREWPQFIAGTVKEWESILTTSAVTFIYPKEASRIRRENQTELSLHDMCTGRNRVKE